MQVFCNIVTHDDPTGIKMLENPTQNLQGYFFPRRSLHDFLPMQEAQKAGVYTLYGATTGSDLPHVHIGQSGTGVGTRLSQNGLKEDFWDMALVLAQQPTMLSPNAVALTAFRMLWQRVRLCEFPWAVNRDMALSSCPASPAWSRVWVPSRRRAARCG